MSAQEVKVGSTFTHDGEVYKVVKIEELQKNSLIHTNKGKQFSLKWCLENSIEFNYEPTPRVGVPWSEERKRITKKEFEHRVGEYIKSHYENYKTHIFNTAERMYIAAELWNQDADIRKYIKLTIFTGRIFLTTAVYIEDFAERIKAMQK